MNRAELRRAEVAKEKQTKTFVLTQAQIDQMKKDMVKEAIDKAIDQAFIIMLALPLEVLITEEYWMKSAKKKIPKFMNDVLRLYKAYEAGDLTIEEMAMDLQEFAGIEVDPVFGVKKVEVTNER